jgi:hypothetical protein
MGPAHCTDLFENFSVNSFKGDLSNDASSIHLFSHWIIPLRSMNFLRLSSMSYDFFGSDTKTASQEGKGG